MKYFIYVIMVASGAFLLNAMDTYDLNDIKNYIGDIHIDYQIEEMEEETFQNRTNSLSTKVGTEIDLGKYPCSENKTSYFFNDICLDNNDLQEIMTTVINNVTPDELESVVNELQAY